MSEEKPEYNIALEDAEFKEGDVFKAIPKIMADIKFVSKDQKNQQQGFKFRGIDDVYNAVQKIMAKHGVFTVPKIVQRKRWEVVSKQGAKGFHILNQYRFRFYGSDGSYFDCFTDGEGIDYGDKGSNKCAAISHKYALLQVLSIPTAETDDPDKEAHEIKAGAKGSPAHASPSKERKVTQKQIARLFALLSNTEMTQAELKDAIYTSYKKESTSDLTMKEYDEICDFIEKQPKKGD